ncbi:hypothetical protein Celaphus_00011254 [Cervus elaphus hippelaphus]|uniref:Uncharacterized protein n=1 Tax=Cervus elaphus hippelaphus TaxID=46360 RepID=A0A212CR27_CEREH|nr:hypothetical protein Celaphus_00011254 [Cervus elaphus hippelaphus]
MSSRRKLCSSWPRKRSAESCIRN